MRSLGKWCLTYAVLLLGACGVLQWLGLDSKPKRHFSHKRHVKDEGMKCEACHREAAKGDHAGMPAMKRCAVCHDEDTEKEKPVEKRLATIYGKGDPTWSEVTKLSKEVRFSHQAHQKAGVACAECHKGIEASEGITDAVRVGKDACMDCHASKKLANECAACHKKIRRDTPPASHRKNWKKGHGTVVRWGGSKANEDRCDLCHSEAACTSCHKDEPPANHTAMWRHRGHGVAASVDRSGCKTCHETAGCDRCHAETAPRNHRALWGSPRNQHCLSCHVSGGTQNCTVCHRGTPSHVSAPAMPGNPAHQTASSEQCRNCHIALKMPHLDNGDDCRGCHK